MEKRGLHRLFQQMNSDVACLNHQHPLSMLGAPDNSLYPFCPLPWVCFSFPLFPLSGFCWLSYLPARNGSLAICSFWNAFTVFISLHGSVTDRLPFPFVRSSHVGKNYDFSCVAGELRPRERVNPQIRPVTEPPPSHGGASSACSRFLLCSYVLAQGQALVNLYWGLKQPLGQTSKSSVPDLSASFLEFSTLQLPLALNVCFSWPYLATFFFFSSLFFLFLFFF